MAVLDWLEMKQDAPITELLQSWSEGDRTALDALIPLVYDELRRMAASYVSQEPASVTVNPTSLVHEAYIRLVGSGSHDFNSRAHFFGVASRLMRQILVDRARARHADKRSGGIRVELEDNVAFTGGRAALVVSLDDALTSLEQQDPNKARILEQRYFGGMTADESAVLLGVTVHEVNRQMRLAHAWLRRELAEHQDNEDFPLSSPAESA